MRSHGRDVVLLSGRVFGRDEIGITLLRERAARETAGETIAKRYPQEPDAARSRLVDRDPFLDFLWDSGGVLIRIIGGNQEQYFRFQAEVGRRLHCIDARLEAEDVVHV